MIFAIEPSAEARSDPSCENEMFVDIAVLICFSARVVMSTRYIPELVAPAICFPSCDQANSLIIPLPRKFCRVTACAFSGVITCGSGSLVWEGTGETSGSDGNSGCKLG